MATPKKLLSNTEVEFVNFLREHPDIAAELLLNYRGKPVRLNWYQRDLLKKFWKRQFGLIIWSRGAGKSFIMAVVAILKALLYPHHAVLIVAGSYRQAQNVFKEVSKIWDESVFVQQSTTKPPSMTPVRCEVIFKHGSRISALPLGDGNKIRGERCQTLIVDEFLAVPEDVVDTVLLPFLNVGSDPWSASATENSILFGTTATYQFNHVYRRYQLFQEKTNPNSPEYDPNYVLSVMNIFDAPKDWLNVKMLTMQLKTMSRVKWLMENMSMFPADSEGYYSAKEINDARKDFVYVEHIGQPDAEYVLGIDPGRESSNFATTVIKLGDSQHQWVFTKALTRKTTQEQINLIREIVRKFNIVLIEMDEGGGGLNLRDYLAEPYKFYDKQRGIWVEEPPIVPIDSNLPGLRILELKHCTAKENTEMNENLRTWLENETLILPRREPEKNEEQMKIFYEIEEAINEILDVTATPLESGYFRFTTKSSRKKDRYSSLLLASAGVKQYLARKRKKPNGDYELRGLVVDGVPWQYNFLLAM